MGQVFKEEIKEMEKEHGSQVSCRDKVKTVIVSLICHGKQVRGDRILVFTSKPVIKFFLFSLQNSTRHGLFSDYDLSFIKVSTRCEAHLLHVITLNTLSESPGSNDLFLREIRCLFTLAVWNMLSTLNYLFTGDKCSWINSEHWSL